MAIKSLELTDLGPFRFRASAASADSGMRIEFDDAVNLFIGPNNVGKSTILQAVSLLTECWTEEFINRYRQTVVTPPSDFAHVAIEWDNGSGQRFESKYGELSDTMRKIERTTNRRKFFAQGSSRSIPSHPSQGVSRDVRNDDWNERKREDFGYVGYARHINSTLDDTQTFEKYSRARGAFEHEVFGTMLQVIAEITEGFPMRLGMRRGGAIVADQTPDGLVAVSELSLGTRYVLSWIIQFIDGFAQRYKGDPEWRLRRGILIVDEIDAHLHASWQRRIIPTLQWHFPNVQIFVSTHSPMMVAGLKKGQVHLLKRNEATGAVEWSPNEQDIIGWTADEIYRTFMGVDEPTDQLTIDRAQRLRELRGKDVLSEDESAEMEELRRQVNEDFMSSSTPLQAQRERYGDMMLEFLRSRHSELSQDGN